MPSFNYLKLYEIFNRAGHFKGDKKITKASKIYPEKLLEGLMEKGSNYLFKLKGDDKDKLQITLKKDFPVSIYDIYDFSKEAFAPPKDDVKIEDKLKNAISIFIKTYLYNGYSKLDEKIPPYIHPKDFDHIIKKYYKQKEDEDKCANDVDFLSQEEVKEVQKDKLIKLPNRQCYDVDYLVEYLISNKNLNLDPSDQTKKRKLWENEKERLFIVNFPGLDPDTKKRYLEMIEEAKREEEKFIESIASDKSKLDFLNKIPILGSILTNDDAANFSTNESGKEFQTAQIAISKFLKILNERQDKEFWLNVSIYGDKSLGKIISSIESTCIHGIGNALAEFYIGIYYLLTVKYKKGITLSKIFIKIDDNNYVNHQLVTKASEIKQKPQSFNNIFDLVVFNVNLNSIIRTINRINLNIDGGYSFFLVPYYFQDINKRVEAWIRFNDNYYSTLNELV